jgi:hypothetical protein
MKEFRKLKTFFFFLQLLHQRSISFLQSHVLILNALIMIVLFYLKT